jgi:hypothetical protein
MQVADTNLITACNIRALPQIAETCFLKSQAGGERRVWLVKGKLTSYVDAHALAMTWGGRQ